MYISVSFKNNKLIALESSQFAWSDCLFVCSLLSFLFFLIVQYFKKVIEIIENVHPDVIHDVISDL